MQTTVEFNLVEVWDGWQPMRSPDNVCFEVNPPASAPFELSASVRDLVDLYRSVKCRESVEAMVGTGGVVRVDVEDGRAAVSLDLRYETAVPVVELEGAFEELLRETFDALDRMDSDRAREAALTEYDRVREAYRTVCDRSRPAGHDAGSRAGAGSRVPARTDDTTVTAVDSNPLEESISFELVEVVPGSNWWRVTSGMAMDELTYVVRSGNVDVTGSDSLTVLAGLYWCARRRQPTGAYPQSIPFQVTATDGCVEVTHPRFDHSITTSYEAVRTALDGFFADLFAELDDRSTPDQRERSLDFLSQYTGLDFHEVYGERMGE